MILGPKRKDDKAKPDESFVINNNKKANDERELEKANPEENGVENVAKN